MIVNKFVDPVCQGVLRFSDFSIKSLNFKKLKMCVNNRPEAYGFLVLEACVMSQRYHYLRDNGKIIFPLHLAVASSV